MKTVHPYFLILGKLTRQGVRYGVVGQMGASFYGSDQTTYDLDLFVEPLEKNVSQLRKLLKKEGLAEIAVSRGQIIKPAPTSREIIDGQITLMYADAYGLTIDVLTAVSGIDFKKLWKRKKIFKLGGQNIHVASLKDIIHSKSCANRPNDRLHLPRLKALMKKKL